MGPETYGQAPAAVALADLAPGIWARVAMVHSADDMGRRLMAMGLTPGTRIRIERVAPLGDPLEIRLRGYSLVIRRAEAANISVHID